MLFALGAYPPHGDTIILCQAYRNVCWSMFLGSRFRAYFQVSLSNHSYMCPSGHLPFSSYLCGLATCYLLGRKI